MNGRPPTGSLRVWLGRLTGSQRALFATGAGLLAGSLWLLATWGRTVPEARATLPLPPMPPEVATEEVVETPFAYEAVVEKNLFAPDRRPPPRAWSETATRGRATAEEAAVPSGPPPWKSYRLHGTVLTNRPETTFALIEADPGRPGPERYSVGDQVGIYRLRRILPTSVVLSGGAVLELKVPDAPPVARGPE